MQCSFVTVIPVAVAFLLVGCDVESITGSARYKEDFHYSYQLSPGGRLSVENFNGPVKIQSWDRNEVEITGKRYASTPELLSALQVKAVATDEFVQVRTVRPSGRRGHMGARYTIRVPRKVELDKIVSSNGSITVEGTTGVVRLRTSNGSVRITGVKGDVEARTSNASIKLLDHRGSAALKTSNGSITADSVQEYLEAKTSNASIHAHILQATGNRPIEVYTSNGSITLELEQSPSTDIIATTSNAGITVKAPASLAVKVKADTSNATIKTDFAVTTRGTLKKSYLEGDVNGGGPWLKLNTSNGGIRLLKRNSGGGGDAGLQ